MQKIKNKKLITLIAIIAVVTLSISGFLIKASIDRSNSKTENVLGLIISQPVVENGEILTGVSDEKTEDVNKDTTPEQDTVEIEEKQSIENNIYKGPKRTPESEIIYGETTPAPVNGNNHTSCLNPTLQAVIVRPYPYHHTLWDYAWLMSGSFETNCININEVSYEWYISGYYDDIFPFRLFSTTAIPDFSQYQTGRFYNLILKVKARGLESEVKSWAVTSNGPYVPEPISYPQ